MKWVIIFLGVAAVVLVTVALLSDGGSASQRFTAERFVEEANDNGAGIELGESLPYAGGGAEVRSVSLAEAHARGGAEEDRHAHAAGTVSVFDSVEAAQAEFRRCQSADLVCFQAANVELTFRGEFSPAEVSKLTAAVSALAE